MKGKIVPFRNLKVNGVVHKQVRISSVDDQGRRFEKAKCIGG